MERGPRIPDVELLQFRQTKKAVIALLHEWEVGQINISRRHFPLSLNSESQQIQATDRHMSCTIWKSSSGGFSVHGLIDSESHREQMAVNFLRIASVKVLVDENHRIGSITISGRVGPREYRTIQLTAEGINTEWEIPVRPPQVKQSQPA